jgi:hypothetical protein
MLFTFKPKFFYNMPSDKVDSFLKGLDTPLKTEILEVRKMILSANKEITEQIKWNAPSFCIGGDDRITFRLQPKNIQLIFHRGAKKRSDEKTFKFTDRSGLVKWITADRGTVTFASMKQIRDRKKEFVELVDRWMAATAD